MPGFQGKDVYVRTIAFSDSIDSHAEWVADSMFFLTQVRGNFREAPRVRSPYLPFKLKDGRKGWLLMDFEDKDSLSWNLRRFSILEYCIKESR
jgi:hypothetical protein